MWMSLMTSGVKILLRPERSRAKVRPPWLPFLDDQLALAGLELVVVVELLAADELLELGRRAEPVDPELALDQLGVGLVPLAGHAIDPERLHLAGDVNRPVVHRVAETGADVSANDLAPTLEHEPCHRAGVAEDDDRAALLVDARARAHLPLDDDVASSNGGSGQRAGVALDDNDPRHHVLAGRPADPTADVNLRAVDQATPEVAERALEADLAAGEDAHPEGVLRPRVLDRDLLDPLLVEEPA